MDIRHNLHQELLSVIDHFDKVDRAFEAIFGRGGTPLVEPYRCDGAEHIVIAMGTLANQFRDVVDQLREQDGVSVGLLAIHLYRPFPNELVRKLLSEKKGVIVYEKALSYGNQGALFGDIKAALYPCRQRPWVSNFIVGLGGREIDTGELLGSLKRSCETSAPPMDDTPEWIGLQVTPQ